MSIIKTTTLSLLCALLPLTWNAEAQDLTLEETTATCAIFALLVEDNDSAQWWSKLSTPNTIAQVWDEYRAMILSASPDERSALILMIVGAHEVCQQAKAEIKE